MRRAARELLNTGIGHTSLIYMIESQLAYLLDALAQARRGKWP